jgi:hypothetical protein
MECGVNDNGIHNKIMKTSPWFSNTFLAGNVVITKYKINMIIYKYLAPYDSSKFQAIISTNSMVRHHPNPEQAQHFNSVLLYMS